MKKLLPYLALAGVLTARSQACAQNVSAPPATLPLLATPAPMPATATPSVAQPAPVLPPTGRPATARRAGALPQERLAPPPPRTPYGATPTLLDVAVSDSSTTYLVFPAAVSLVDVGMLNNYLIKIEATSVFIRARGKHTPPTPVMVRYGNKYWMGRLVGVKHPVLMLYDFTKPGALTPPPEKANLTPAEMLGPDAIVAPGQENFENLDGVDAADVAGSNAPGLQTSTGNVLLRTSPGVGPDNELAIDRSVSAKDRLLARLRLLSYEPVQVHSVAYVDNRLSFSLVNVRNDKQFTYLRFQLVNRSSIDYQVDLADFTLVENAKKRFLGKKRNEARRPMMPAAGRANQRIPANSTGYIYYAVPLFAATNEGFLAVGLRELSGARAIALNIPSKVINTAPTFKAPLQ